MEKQQQEHLQTFLQQRQTLLKELENMQNELNLKKEHFLKVQGAIEYIQQCAVSPQSTFSSETPDQKGTWRRAGGVVWCAGTQLTNLMIVDREVSNSLVEMQEDVAEHFTHENFPLSGEAYWTMVECIAHAKLKQLQGLIDWMDYKRLKEELIKTTPQNVKEANEGLFNCTMTVPAAAKHCGMTQKEMKLTFFEYLKYNPITYK